MKLKPKYDYYLNINGHLFLLPYKIWTEGPHVMIKAKHFQTVISSDTVPRAYQNFEKEIYKAIKVMHLQGEIWKLFPERCGLFEAESAQLVAYPYRTPFQKWIGRMKTKIKDWDERTNIL